MTTAAGRLPVLGHLLSLAPDPIRFLQSLRAQGDLVAFHIGPRPIYQVNSPDLIREVLVTRGHDFHRGEIFAQARRVLGDGLATADEPDHLRQRRVVQPAFHHDRLPAYRTVMREQARAVSESWIPYRKLALDRELTRLTLTITAKSLFRAELGQRAVDEVRRSLAPVINGIAARAALPADWVHRLPIPANRRFGAALHRLTTVVDEVIAAYRAHGVDHGDLLSRLVAAETNDAEVRTQVLHLLMAGTDTTATTLSWLFYELARDPALATRVREEPAFVEPVLTETLRRHTPIWLLLRRSTETVRLGGTTLPAGTEVLVNLPTLHRDPVLYPDPMRFDPDRWLDSPPDLEQRGRFIPFGAGAHKCVGADFAWAAMTTAASVICAQWRLSLDGRVREVPRAFLRPSALPVIPRPV